MFGHNASFYSEKTESNKQIEELNQRILRLQRRAEMQRLNETQSHRKSISFTQEFFEGLKIVGS